MRSTAGAGQQQNSRARSRPATIVRALVLVVFAILAHDLMMLDAASAHGRSHGSSSIERTPHHGTGHRAPDGTLSGKPGHPPAPEKDGSCGVDLEAVILAGHPVPVIDAEQQAGLASPPMTGSSLPVATVSSGHDPTRDPRVRRALLQIFRV